MSFRPKKLPKKPWKKKKREIIDPGVKAGTGALRGMPEIRDPGTHI